MNIKADLEKATALKPLAKKYGVAVSTASRWYVKHGVTPRSEQIREKNRILGERLKAALGLIPNMAEVCRRNPELNYFYLMQKRDKWSPAPVRENPEYILARSICKVCGVKLKKDRGYFERLCPEHRRIKQYGTPEQKRKLGLGKCRLLRNQFYGYKPKTKKYTPVP